MVTFTSADDRRQSYKANQSRRAVNAARQRKATVENVDWAMSRPSAWYKDRENLASIKNTLANVPAVTTDQDEGRNMYQILMNQMRGGDKGARLIDTRGLPDQAYRTGRKIFQDPSKSQGFFGDMRTMAGDLIPGLSRSPNPAAIHVNEWNPFPKAGFGKDWYKEQFPIASGLGSLMEAGENFIPYASWIKRLLPSANQRVPLERDLSWVPEGLGEYDKLPMMEFEDDIETIAETPLRAVDRSDNWWYTPPFDDEVSIMDLPIEEDITETITEDDTETITEDDGEQFKLQVAKGSDLGNLGVGNEYSPSVDLNIMNIKDRVLRDKATDAAMIFHYAYLQGEGGKYYGQLEDLYQEYLDAVEAGAQ